MLDFSFEKFPISTSVWPDPCQPIPFASSYCISLDSRNACLASNFSHSSLRSRCIASARRSFTISMHRAGLKSQFYGVAARTSTEKRHIKSENSHCFDLPQTHDALNYNGLGPLPPPPPLIRNKIKPLRSISPRQSQLSSKCISLECFKHIQTRHPRLSHPPARLLYLQLSSNEVSPRG